MSLSPPAKDTVVAFSSGVEPFAAVTSAMRFCASEIAHLGCGDQTIFASRLRRCGRRDSAVREAAYLEWFAIFPFRLVIYDARPLA
jgi:hypothetical protein